MSDNFLYQKKMFDNSLNKNTCLTTSSLTYNEVKSPYVWKEQRNDPKDYHKKGEPKCCKCVTSSINWTHR